MEKVENGPFWALLAPPWPARWRFYNYDTISSHLIPWGSVECLFLTNYCSYRSEILQAVFSANDHTFCKISIKNIEFFVTYS